LTVLYVPCSFDSGLGCSPVHTSGSWYQAPCSDSEGVDGSGTNYTNQLKAQGPSRTCNERKEEEVKKKKCELHESDVACTSGVQSVLKTVTRKSITLPEITRGNALWLSEQGKHAHTTIVAAFLQNPSQRDEALGFRVPG